MHVALLLTKIIADPSGSIAAAGLHHGCPFKNFDETELRVTLQQVQHSYEKEEEEEDSGCVVM